MHTSGISAPKTIIHISAEPMDLSVDPVGMCGKTMFQGYQTTNEVIWDMETYMTYQVLYLNEDLCPKCVDDPRFGVLLLAETDI